MLYFSHSTIVFKDDKFHTFVTTMAEFSINPTDWQKLKLKVLRKYRELSEEDLAFSAGQEDKLIEHLMERLKRNREYVVFTLQKGLANIDNNRL